MRGLPALIGLVGLAHCWERCSLNSLWQPSSAIFQIFVPLVISSDDNYSNYLYVRYLWGRLKGRNSLQAGMLLHSLLQACFWYHIRLVRPYRCVIRASSACRLPADRPGALCSWHDKSRWNVACLTLPWGNSLVVLKKKRESSAE